MLKAMEASVMSHSYSNVIHKNCIALGSYGLGIPSTCEQLEYWWLKATTAHAANYIQTSHSSLMCTVQVVLPCCSPVPGRPLMYVLSELH